MQFRLFLAAAITCFLVLTHTETASAAGYRIPADNYRSVDCGQLTQLITTVVALRQQGMSLDQAYDAVTPKGASTRVQLLHMITISGFYQALGGVGERVIGPSDLQQLESICTDTEIITAVIGSTNATCLALDEISPLVRILQNRGIPLQGASKQVSSLMLNLPIPEFNSHTYLARKLPKLFEEYVSAVYNQPDQSASQQSSRFMQQCAINEPG